MSFATSYSFINDKSGKAEALQLVEVVKCSRHIRDSQNGV